MSAGSRRRLAELACVILQATLPARLRPWGSAIRHEVAEIPDDTDALIFALHGLWGLAPRIIAFHLVAPFAGLASANLPQSKGPNCMDAYHDIVPRPRAVGIACAVGAVLLGLAYLAVAGAPIRYLAINAAALVLGLALLALGVRVIRHAARWPGATTLMMGLVLLGTALLGDPSAGAARWIRLGPVSVQPSLVLLPLMVVGYARARHALSTAGLMIAAAALAIQPDRAMAGMLAAGLAMLAITRPDRLALTAFLGSVAAFGVTLARADVLPAVPFVDQVLFSSFQVHAFAGVAVLAGCGLLILPAILGKRADVGRGEVYLVFGTVWIAAIMAAALGNYPTPIVGYGGSAILGYLLSLTMLPAAASGRSLGEAADQRAGDAAPADRHLRMGLAVTS